jgi:hypothetical protein
MTDVFGDGLYICLVKAIERRDVSLKSKQEGEEAG